LARTLVLGVAGILAACTRAGGGGIGLASGQDRIRRLSFAIFHRRRFPRTRPVTRVRPFVEDDDYSATL
jgi:hypothetical protein